MLLFEEERLLMKVVCFESYQIFNAIEEQIKFIGQGLQQGRKQYIIVPDRFSLSMEKLVMEKLNLTSSFDFEVLTISRLANLVLDNYNGKKVLSMLDAIMLVQFLLKKNKEHLVCFNKIPITTRFAKVLFDSISQIKSCKITPQRLKNIVNKLPKGNLQQKMNDIALIYGLYEEYIQDNFVDSNNKISLLCERLQISNIFKNADVHFCNFSDFTAQDYDVILNSIKSSNSTSITLLKPENQNNSAVYLAKINMNIKNICDNLGVEMERVKSADKLNSDQKHICTQIFSLCPEIKEIADKGSVQLYSANNISDEVEFVAKKILHLLSKGRELKEVSVNCSDFATYQNIIEYTFDKYNIPYWLDKNFKLEDTEQYKMLSAIFDCVQWGYLQDDVLRVAMNGLAGLTQEQRELFDAYAKKYGIIGTMWTQPLTLKNKDENFEQFEDIKQSFMKVIIDFEKEVQGSTTIAQFCEAFLKLNEQLNLAQKLQDLSLYFEGKGVLKQASILRQSNDKIVKIIQQLEEILGEQEVTFEEWLDMFDAGVQATEITPLPMSISSIFVGQMLSSVFEPTPYCFVLGAVEGKLPAWVQDVGIISDADILALQELEISPTIKDLNKRTVCVIQQNLTFATKQLVVTMPENIKNDQCQQSRVLEQLSTMFTRESNPLPIVQVEKCYKDIEPFKTEDNRLMFLFPTLDNMLVWLAENKNTDSKMKDVLTQCLLSGSLKDLLTRVLNQQKVETQVTNVEKLFFTNGYTKATELEKFFSCPFQHFVEYGLKLQEKQSNKVRPVDIGNILHDIVEKFAKYSQDKKLNDKEIESFAVSTFKSIMNRKEYEHLLFGTQNKALAKGLEQESIRVCKGLNYQNQHSKYKIMYAEASFGESDFVPMPEIIVYKTDRKLKMRGKVDRVDIWNERFRVVDYKTGKNNSEFHMLDLYLGKKIQLFIYLYAIMQGWKDKQPSGAFYFPLHNEYKDSKPTFPYQSYCMDGVTVGDFDNLSAQDDQMTYENNQSSIIKFALNNTKKAMSEGLLEGKDDKNLLNQTQLIAMINYSYKVFSKALGEILSGYIEPKPLDGSCSYCASKTFCPYYTKEEQRPRDSNFDIKKTVFEEVTKNE